MSEWLVEKTSSLIDSHTSRRGFIMRAALAGSAVAVAPLRYLLRPGTAYAAICGCAGSSCDCRSLCCDGYTEFCCTLTGQNSCPPGSFMAGWWAASGSALCPSGTRYVIDCNALCTTRCGCGCAQGNCGHRRTCCNLFRYGQCHQEIGCFGRIVCRMHTCTPPYELTPSCTRTVLVDHLTANHSAACLTAPAPPADFVRTPDGVVYRKVGGTALRIFNCAPLGGCRFDDVADLSTFAAYPVNGTFVRAAETGRIYRVAGGAPLLLSSCGPLAGCPGVEDVNQATVDVLDHLRAVPANGTFLRGVETGAIYRVAGGSPFRLSDCAPLGGCPGVVDVNQFTIDNLDHLAAVPADGTVVRGAETGLVYRVAGGAPLRLTSCTHRALAAACANAVTLNQFAINSLDRLRAVPANGTFLRSVESSRMYRVAGGAPLAVSDCRPLAGCAGAVLVNQATVDSLDHLAASPAEGTILRGAETGRVYRVAGGAPLRITSCTHRALAAACADVVDVNQASIDGLDRMRAVPADGTFLRAVETLRVYRVAGGAPLFINDCAVLDGCPNAVNVNQATVDLRDHMRSVPEDGTVLLGRPSNTYWRITGGCRQPTSSTASAVAVTDDAVNSFSPC